MNHLHLRYLKASNILCFGPEGVEIHFDDLGRVVQIIGENLDLPRGEHGELASNASGKSSIHDLISLALYGEMVKNPKKIKTQKIINAQADKGTVEIQWDDFRVVRTLKRKGSSTIDMWKSADHIWDKKSYLAQTAPETQAKIIKEIGLSHLAFCYVMVVDDTNAHAFLRAEAADKREIVENLLGLNVYRGYHKTAKEKLKAAKDHLDTLTKEYDRLKHDLETCDARIAKVVSQEENWRATKQYELKTLGSRLKTKQEELEATDYGAALQRYQKAQEQINLLQTETDKDEVQKAKLEGFVNDSHSKLEQQRELRQRINTTLQEHVLKHKELEGKIAEAKERIQNLESLAVGTKCSVCHGVISSENFNHVLGHEHNVIASASKQIDKTVALIDNTKQEFGEKSAQIQKYETLLGQAQQNVGVLSQKIRQRNAEIATLQKIQKPDQTSAQQVLESEIGELRRQLKAKEEESQGPTPYQEILQDARKEKETKEKECSLKNDEIKSSEADIPYYEFWVKAFGDDGIRRFVIAGIMPSLNERVAHWLNVLIDGCIEIVFDDQLDATITRNGTLVDYFNLSNGEGRRVDLAVSQAFAYVMILNAGACLNVIFLDEVTGGGIDRAGVSGVYNMIFELAKERQVFVTTHNDTLMSLLQGCETLKLRKENDFSSLVS